MRTVTAGGRGNGSRRSGRWAAERGLAPERVQEYAAALEFRRTPRVRPPDDWRAAWERARGFWCESVAGAAGCAVDAETETVLRQLHAGRSLHGRKGIRNLLRWVVKTHSPGSVCDWLDAPELRMLRRIYRLLAAAEPDRNGPECGRACAFISVVAGNQLSGRELSYES